ncbi:MAG: hypothetical protein ACR2PH_15650, partial [Desulfobulbia bacterium]
MTKTDTKTNAKTQTAAEKITSIEQTVEKSKIRSEIINQSIEMVERYGIDSIMGATLPAENAYFENLFVHLFET